MSLVMHLLRIVAPLAVAVLLAGCSSGASEGSAAQPAASTAPEDGYLVQDYTFAPLTVAPGEVVRVLDGDDEPHTVTAVDGSFDTGAFDESEPGTFTAPSTPGDYEIFCTIHPSMRGTITVR